METNSEKEKPENEPVEPPKEEPAAEAKSEANGEPSEEEKKKKERVEKILATGKDLYQLFTDAGFNRDSFIELGESVKVKQPFEKLHPVVAKKILKIAAGIIDRK